MEDEYGLTVKFGLKDESTNTKYKAKSKLRIYDGINDDVLLEIGFEFNNFLRQVGYVRKEDYMLMEDLTEEEVEYLKKCLANRRGTSI